MTPKKSIHSTEEQTGLVISVKITPRAPKNEIIEILENGTIKIRLTAPPVEGKANQDLIIFLSEILDIAKSKIKILSGQTSHTKLISISGLERPFFDAAIRSKIK